MQCRAVYKFYRICLTEAWGSFGRSLRHLLSLQRLVPPLGVGCSTVMLVPVMNAIVFSALGCSRRASSSVELQLATDNVAPHAGGGSAGRCIPLPGLLGHRSRLVFEHSFQASMQSAVTVLTAQVWCHCLWVLPVRYHTFPLMLFQIEWSWHRVHPPTPTPEKYTSLSQSVDLLHMDHDTVTLLSLKQLCVNWSSHSPEEVEHFLPPSWASIF